MVVPDTSNGNRSQGGAETGTVPDRRRKRISPLSYKRWNIKTYIAFHALRTYVIINCIKNNYPNELVVSRRVLATKIKENGYNPSEFKIAFREFIRRYKETIKTKKHRWMIIDCKKLLDVEYRLFRHILKHSDIVLYINVIDDKIKKILDI